MKRRQVEHKKQTHSDSVRKFFMRNGKKRSEYQRKTKKQCGLLCGKVFRSAKIAERYHDQVLNQMGVVF